MNIKKLFKRHWLKLVGMGLTLGSTMIDSVLEQREMREMKESLKKEIIKEMEEKK